MFWYWEIKSKDWTMKYFAQRRCILLSCRSSEAILMWFWVTAEQLGHMKSRGSFQPYLFCDSLTVLLQSLIMATMLYSLTTPWGYEDRWASLEFKFPHLIAECPAGLSMQQQSWVATGFSKNHSKNIALFSWFFQIAHGVKNLVQVAQFVY